MYVSFMQKLKPEAAAVVERHLERSRAGEDSEWLTAEDLIGGDEHDENKLIKHDAYPMPKADSARRPDMFDLRSCFRISSR